MCQESKEVPHEDSNPGYYRDGSDGIRYYGRLEAHGDYSKLKLIIRTKKRDYNFGEPVWIKFYVRNDSDGEIHIVGHHSVRWEAHLSKLFHSNYDEVVKTPIWEEEFQKRIQRRDYDHREGIAPWGMESGYNYLKLQPGQERELDWFPLNYYYELTKPDTYELTCFLTTFIKRQYYETPLQSNTLTFRILETPVAEDYWYRDGTQRGGEPQHIPYTNPPPGEEVFKQPKPPKNVFYVHTNDEPYILYPDVSPYTYYRQKAKEAEAAKAERPVE